MFAVLTMYWMSEHLTGNALRVTPAGSCSGPHPHPMPETVAYYGESCSSLPLVQSHRIPFFVCLLSVSGSPLNFDVSCNCGWSRRGSKKMGRVRRLCSRFPHPRLCRYPVTTRNEQRLFYHDYTSELASAYGSGSKYCSDMTILTVQPRLWQVVSLNYPSTALVSSFDTNCFMQACSRPAPCHCCYMTAEKLPT